MQSASIRITASGGAPMYFDLVKQQGHTVAEVSLGPEGPVSFSMNDWSDGLLTVEEGIEYRKGSRKYLHAAGVDASFPGQAIAQSVATVISVGSGPVIPGPVEQLDFVPSGGTINTYIVGGRYVHRLVNPGTTNDWTVALDLGAGRSALDATVHGDKLSVADGNLNYSTNGTTWTNASTAAHALGVLNENVQRAVRPNTLYAASAVDGSWNSGSTIADSSFDINSLTALEQILMIGKEDGVYSIDSEGVVTPFTPELRTQANSAFAGPGAVAVFNGDYYFRTLNGVVQISGADGQKRRIGIDQMASPDLTTPVVRSFAWDDRFVYALLDSGSTNDVYILRRSIGGAWHVFYRGTHAAHGDPAHVGISAALGYPALFSSFNLGGATHQIRFIRLPTLPNPLQDTNYKYDTTTTKTIRMPRFGTADAQVTFDQLSIQSLNLAAGVTIACDISVDSGTYTAFGAAQTTSPVATITGTAITGNYFDVRFTFATNSATTTPVLRGFSLKGLWRPEKRRIHTYTVQADVGHPARAGSVRESPVTTIANLNTLRAHNTYAAVVDENEQTFSALIHQVSRVLVEEGPNEEPSHALRIVLWEKAS